MLILLFILTMLKDQLIYRLNRSVIYGLDFRHGDIIFYFQNSEVTNTNKTLQLQLVVDVQNLRTKATVNLIKNRPIVLTHLDK